MKLLTSAALSAILVFTSATVFAEDVDFSKTVAAQPGYDFSKSQPAEGNNVQQSTAEHDFSNTPAVSRQYDFSNNEAAEKDHNLPSTTQHDCSPTDASKHTC